VRVTILTFGSLGDVQPYVALGLGLQATGHAVRLATHAPFETLVRSRGLDFFPVDGNPRGILETDAGSRWLDTGRNPLGFVRGLLQVIEPLMVTVMQQCMRACQDADAILVSLLGFYAGYHIAERMKVPLFLAYYLPVSPTRAFPSTVLWFDLPLGGPLNRFSHYLAGQLFWHPLRAPLNRVRQELLDLPPLPFWGIAREIFEERWPILYGYSPTVLPRPAEWGPRIHVTGYWFLDRSDEWQPPADLVDFLQAGPPPVSIGFGSMNTRDPEATTSLVLEAVARARQRAVLLTGWGGLTQADLPDEVFKIEAVPHDWLFPQVAAVVHHGGAGTTAAALWAGVPSVIIPFFADQPFWGWRVCKLGAAPRPIPRRRLTARRLADAIQAAVGDRDMRRRSALLGERIRSEHGVARAVEAFHQHAAALCGV